MKFVHTPKPRQFNYRPLYFDPEKEAREKRRKELIGSGMISEDDDSSAPGEYRRGEYIREMKIRRGVIANHTPEKRKAGSIRMVIFIILLLLAGLLLLR